MEKSNTNLTNWVKAIITIDKPEEKEKELFEKCQRI